MINVRKRGKVYQYQFETARVNGKRKQISKSGFRTKNEAYIEGAKAYDKYINGRNRNESYMSYSDYLDYWLENYCEVYLKYSTIEEYSIIANKYLKSGLGKYRLNSITSFQLNKYLTEAYMKHDYSYGYLRNFSKVIKSSFRDACDIFGFIDYNPAITLRLPKIEAVKKSMQSIYIHKMKLIEFWKDLKRTILLPAYF